MAIQWKLNDVICISYNTAVRDLPDIHTHKPEGTQHPSVSAYISGKSKPGCVITCILHFAKAYFAEGRRRLS